MLIPRLRGGDKGVGDLPGQSGDQKAPIDGNDSLKTWRAPEKLGFDGRLTLCYTVQVGV